jgi:hypothetical protein
VLLGLDWEKIRKVVADYVTIADPPILSVPLCRASSANGSILAGVQPSFDRTDVPKRALPLPGRRGSVSSPMAAPEHRIGVSGRRSSALGSVGAAPPPPSLSQASLEELEPVLDEERQEVPGGVGGCLGGGGKRTQQWRWQQSHRRQSHSPKLTLLSHSQDSGNCSSLLEPVPSGAR